MFRNIVIAFFVMAAIYFFFDLQSAVFFGIGFAICIVMVIIAIVNHARKDITEDAEKSKLR